MTRVALLLLPLALLATAFAPVSAAEAGDCITLDDGWRYVPYELCESQAWFKSRNITKLDNIAYLDNFVPLIDEDYPTWSEERPDGVSSGGYLGQAHSAQVMGYGANSGITYQGQHHGVLRSIAIEQYVALAGDPARDSYTMVLTVKTERNRLVYMSDTWLGDSVSIEPAGLGIHRIRFVLTDLAYPWFQYYDYESGTLYEEQILEINISPLERGDEAMFLYGAEDVPSRIVFNPMDTSGYTKIDASQG